MRERGFNTMKNIEPKLKWGIRLFLIVITIGLITIFTLAVVIHPYDAEGKPLTMESHRQLGLGKCEFVVLFNKPCPSCGLTTSFSLLMHGSIMASLRANWVGTFMAISLFGAILWCMATLVRGRYLWIRSLERAILSFVVFFSILLILRWGVIMLSYL